MDDDAPEAELHRYILFAGHRYYPSGGGNDEVGRYDTLEEAEAATKNGGAGSWDWAHVLYTPTLEWIWLAIEYDE